MYHPTEEELQIFIASLKTLFILLPSIRRRSRESSKTFFIRTLHEVSAFRQIDMFHR